MSTSVEAPSILQVTKEDSFDSQDAVIFVGFCLVLGIASRHLFRGSKVPYTVSLLVLGIALGSIEYGTNHGLGKLGAGIRIWANINPDLLLCVFLPALLFESSFAMEVHQIKRCIAQMLLLAVPGVLISTLSLGVALKLAFPYNWNWKIALLLGGLLSATDPVAIVALLKDLGISKKLSTIIEGESLMNDGTAIVVYQLFYQMVLGRSYNAETVIKFLSQVSFGAVALGLAFGLISVLWLGFIFNDTVIEIALTLAVSYIAYFTGQNVVEVSGVLTVMTLGMFYAAVGRTSFKGENHESLHHFWEMVAYVANTLIFIISGVVIAQGVFHSDKHFKNSGTSWFYLLLLYVLVQVSRVVVVCALYPFLRYFGYGLSWKEAIVLMWSGLRGAVALSLALSIKRAEGKLSPVYLEEDVGTMVVFFTGGIVFLTLVVNGSTAQFILHLLGLDRLSLAKTRVLEYTKYEMLNKALEAFADLGEDEELGPTDWSSVKRYLRCLNELEERIHPHTVQENESHLYLLNLQDIRVRLLNGVQAAYWVMLEEGRISQITTIILMQSVNESIDLSSSDPLCDWKSLKHHIHFPSYYRFLQAGYLPPKLVTYFTVERLESACYMCAAFLRAHRIARQQLHEFIGDSDIANVVMDESIAEGSEAKKFLEDVNVTFPQVLRVIKTRQVTYSILKHLSEYVRDLEKLGLLEKKEMDNLHDSVQTDLKKLLRNPPVVKMPKVWDVLRSHPLLGALAAESREPILGTTKEVLKLRGAALYKEGSKPKGIWLISNGVVKWSSKSLSNWHSLHPTFSHGSTLGLFEVLVGRPYLCDIITDSVVRCFFIESSMVQSLLRSSEVENFFWQEASVVIAKILLPEAFEKIAVQDMRSLISDGTRMKRYLSGEIIEIESQFVCILLEGFVRAQEKQQDLISSPAVLVPPHAILNLKRIAGGKDANFYRQGSIFQVEARARTIFLDIALLGSGDGVLQKGSPSGYSLLVDRKSHMEHAGLMSWPNNLMNVPRCLSDNVEKQHNSLSQRAMQLGIYGNMVNTSLCRSNQHLQGNFSKKPAYSLSFPRISGKRNEHEIIAAQSDAGTLVTTESRIPVGMRSTTEWHHEKYSSDESEDEAIVQVESLSTLTFHLPDNPPSSNHGTSDLQSGRN